MAMTNLTVHPIGGGKLMATCEYTGATSATIDVGLSVIDNVSILSRGGSSDVVLGTVQIGKMLYFEGVQIAGRYMIKAIGN